MEVSSTSVDNFKINDQHDREEAIQSHIKPLTEQDLMFNARQTAKKLDHSLKKPSKLNNKKDILSEAFVNRGIHRLMHYINSLDIQQTFSNDENYKNAMQKALIYYYMVFFRHHPNVVMIIKNSGILKVQEALFTIASEIYKDTETDDNKKHSAYTQPLLKTGQQLRKQGMKDFGLPLDQAVLNTVDDDGCPLPLYDDNTYSLLLLTTAQFGLTEIAENENQRQNRHAGTLKNFPKGGFFAPENKIYDFLSNVYDKPLYDKHMAALQQQLISIIAPHTPAASAQDKLTMATQLFKKMLNDFQGQKQRCYDPEEDGKETERAIYIQDMVKEIALIHYKHQSQCDIAQSCTELMIELTQHMLAIANGNDIGDSVQLILEHIERHNNDFQNTLATYKPDLMTLVENSEKNKLEEGSSQHLFFSNHQKETAVESVLPISGVIELQKIIKKVTTQHPLEKNKRQQTIRIIDSLKNNINQAANDIQKPVALQYIKSLFIAINALSIDVDNDFFKKTVTKNLKKALIESCQTAAQCWLLGFTGIPLDKWQQSQYHLYKRWGRNTTVVYHQTTLNFAAINSLLDKHLRTSPKLLGSKDFINDVKHLQKTVFPQLMEERARLNNWKEQPKANYCRFM
ncbi:MAG: hypothetical protein ACX932_00065 [Gammaproteobacteria bacterium]